MRHSCVKWEGRMERRAHGIGSFGTSLFGRPKHSLINGLTFWISDFHLKNGRATKEKLPLNVFFMLNVMLSMCILMPEYCWQNLYVLGMGKGRRPNTILI